MAWEGASGELGARTSQELSGLDLAGVNTSWILTRLWADVTHQGQETRAWWEYRGSDSGDLPGGCRPAGVASLC